MRIIFFLIFLFAGWSAAAETTVVVSDGNGEPVGGAVVWINEGNNSDNSAAQLGPAIMAQQNKSFAPYALAVPVGARVEFPNRDRFRHHVYSFSKGNSFELELYGREEKRFVTFDTPGVVAVGCNIHDNMIGFIRVMDNTEVVYTNENGAAVISTSEGNAKEISVWHPNANDGEPVIAALNGATIHVSVSMDAMYEMIRAAGE